MIRKASKWLAAVLGLCIAVTAFLAYFVRKADLKNGVIYDGLGRVLTEPPAWARIFLTDEPSWAGLGWHLGDIGWFFGGALIAFKLYEWGNR